MSTANPKKNTAVQVFRFSAKLAIRIEYDKAEQRQSVFVNGELRSSFYCPVGYQATHEFKGVDAIAMERGRLSIWRIRIAAESDTYRIRYEICRRDSDGSDTKWYLWDHNVKHDDWDAIPEYDSDEDEDEDEEVSQIACGTCGSNLACPKCNPQESRLCPGCGNYLAGLECNSRESPLRLIYDVARMQEALEDISPTDLHLRLIEYIGEQSDSSTTWADMIVQILVSAGHSAAAMRFMPAGSEDVDDE